MGRKHNPDTKKILEVLSIAEQPVKRSEIFRKTETPDNYKLSWVLETMVDLKLIYRIKQGFYDITERGQNQLNWMRLNGELDG
jgi:hypothetical protein